MEDLPLGKRIIKSVIVLAIAVAIIIPIAIVFGMIGIPLWPFIIFTFMYTGIDKFDASKLPWTAASVAFGIVAGMGQGVFGELLGEAAALPCFGVLALILCTGFIMGDVKWTNFTGLLFMTILTLFPFEPWQLAGLDAASGVTWVSALIRVLASFALAVLVFFIVGKVMASRAAKAGVAAEAAEE